MTSYRWSLIAGILLALPTLLAAYPPMGDLPAHEAIVGLLAHWKDATFTPRGVYELNFGHPNQLWYCVAVPLAMVMGATWACKLTIAASIVAMPVATARASRYFGRQTWASVLVAPLAIGWIYYWGLVANLLAVPLLALTLPVFDAHVRAPTLRGVARATAAMVLLYCAHQSALIAGCVAYAIFAVPHRRQRLADFVWMALPVLAIAAVCVWQQFYQRSFLWGVNAEQLDITPLPRKLMLIPGVLFSGHPIEVQVSLFLLSAGVILAAAFSGRTSPTETGFRARYSRRQLEIVAFALFVLYLAAPSAYHQHRLIYHRFLPFAWLFLVIGRAPRINARTRPLIRIAAAAVPLATLLVNWPQFAESNRIYRGLDSLIDMIEPGQSVYLIETAPREPKLFPVSTAAGHVVARKGGRQVLDMTDLAILPLRRNPACRWPLSAARLQKPHLAFAEFRPRHDFKRFRYLLVHTFDLFLYDFLAYATTDSAKLVGNSGEWLLFESTLEVHSPCVPDQPLERNDDTLAERLSDLKGPADK